MKKSAISVDEQIDLLTARGMRVTDRAKAHEVLMDVGYFRLGFYLFPFEKSYPSLHHRTHEYIDGARFEDAMNLYYFDFDLRLLLMRYLNRIEIAFRTVLNYNMSMKYMPDSTWFANPSIVGNEYSSGFKDKIYTSDFKRIPVIQRHHRKNPDEKFAPAWKTLEYMTFGAVMKLYEQLKDINDKVSISNRFGIRQVVTFESYMHTIRQVRNACAHGFTLFDMHLPRRIKRGPAGNNPTELGNIIGALRVIGYIMEQISPNRAMEMRGSIRSIYQSLIGSSPILRGRIFDFTTL